MIDRRTSERLRAVEALIARGATAGERSAAREAKARMLKRLGITEDDAADQLRAYPDPLAASKARWEADVRAAAQAEMERRRKAAAERAEAAAKAAAERARKAAWRDHPLVKQKQMQRIIGMIMAGGATGYDIAGTLNVEEHTVRAAISRLRKVGVPIKSWKPNEGGRYALYIMGE